MLPSPSHSIDVTVLPAFSNRVAKGWLRGVAANALTSCHDAPLAVSLVLADDATVHDLNLQYRGLDETTDVLAFPLGTEAHADKDDVEFLLPESEPTSIGEVVLSYPQALRQARAARKRVKQELALLVVHGVLHLMGYDHAEPDDERRMWAKQDLVLATIAGT